MYLNIEGTNCIREINSLALQQQNSSAEDNTNNANSQRNNSGFSRLDEQQQEQDRQLQDTMLQQSYELRKHCFLVTNLYVYSLFGIIIGFIVLVIWYTRYKRIWTMGKRNSRDDEHNQIGFR